MPGRERVLVLSLIALPAVLRSAVPQPEVAKPNIIMFIADDVSWNDIGCYGNKDVKTPNIDRIASKGIRFNSFFLAASSSSPSRNSIITGRYPHNTGGSELHTEPPDYMVLFPEILRQNGYYTAHAGKFHMGTYARRGFDSINENGKLNGDGGEELWLKCINERPADKPFFMWFAAYDAHRVWGPNEFSSTHNPETITPPFYLGQGEKTKKDIAKYYDEIARFDHYIGIVYKELLVQNILDNTIIIIMADNGRPFPHSKTRVNDRGLKSPFIVHWPEGIGKKRRECESLVSSIDIAPTLLELASAKIPPAVQGQSFVRLLDDPDHSFRNFVFAEHNWHDYEAHERMIRTEEFLYILNSRPQFPQMGPADAIGSPAFRELDSLRKSGLILTEQSDVFITPRPSEELYDCISDPEQFDNLADDREYAKELNNLRNTLREWMKVTGDNIPDNLTKDWYLRESGYIKTKEINIRGEQVHTKFDATKNNNKGKF